MSLEVSTKSNSYNINYVKHQTGSGQYQQCPYIDAEVSDSKPEARRAEVSGSHVNSAYMGDGLRCHFSGDMGGVWLCIFLLDACVTLASPYTLLCSVSAYHLRTNALWHDNAINCIMFNCDVVLVWVCVVCFYAKFCMFIFIKAVDKCRLIMMSCNTLKSSTL